MTRTQGKLHVLQLTVSDSLVCYTILKKSMPCMPTRGKRDKKERGIHMHIDIIPGRKDSCLDMVLVVTLDNRVSKEIIIRCQILPSTCSPVHILFLPSKAIIVVSQA